MKAETSAEFGPNGSEPAAEAAEPSEEPSKNGAPEEDWNYVPMSEWGDELE